MRRFRYVFDLRFDSPDQKLTRTKPAAHALAYQGRPRLAKAEPCRTDKSHPLAGMVTQHGRELAMKRFGTLEQ